MFDTRPMPFINVGGYTAPTTDFMRPSSVGPINPHRFETLSESLVRQLNPPVLTLGERLIENLGVRSTWR